MGLFGKRKRAQPAGETTSLYYASDVHGSDQCWRKFLGAGRHYGVDSLVMGGDLTGKAIVTIARAEDGAFTLSFLGDTRTGRTDEELEEQLAAIRFNGMYPWVAGPQEIARVSADPALREALFQEVIVAELRRWIELADERMAGYGIDVFVMPGNDDPWSCDAVLEEASHVTACDDRVVRVGPHEMISCAYANPTPWDSPRELPEDELYTRLKALSDQLEAPESAIFNLHVPPFDSGLDMANEINEDLTLRYVGGQPHPVPVGSTAVRQLIEEVQPLLALHGHIHECRGDTRIGRTLAINTGSEYNSGHIHGAVITLADGEVVKHRLVVG